MALIVTVCIINDINKKGMVMTGLSPLGASFSATFEALQEAHAQAEEVSKAEEMTICRRVVALVPLIQRANLIDVDQDTQRLSERIDELWGVLSQTAFAQVSILYLQTLKDCYLVCVKNYTECLVGVLGGIQYDPIQRVFQFRGLWKGEDFFSKDNLGIQKAILAATKMLVSGEEGEGDFIPKSFQADEECIHERALAKASVRANRMVLIEHMVGLAKIMGPQVFDEMNLQRSAEYKEFVLDCIGKDPELLGRISVFAQDPDFQKRAQERISFYKTAQDIYFGGVSSEER